MKVAMRKKLARESFEEKIRKVSQLIRLAKKFPRRTRNEVLSPAARRNALADEF